MPHPRQRRREPEALQARLLEVTARLISEQGLQAVTINAVAAEAGTTKGGLFHHFPSKEALIAAVAADQIRRFDDAIDTLMARDPVEHGRFTRAYVTVLLHDASQAPIGNLSLALVADADLRQVWFDWAEERGRRHAATDADQNLELVRYAADGAWMAGLSPAAGMSPAARSRIAQRLLAATMRQETRA